MPRTSYPPKVKARALASLLAGDTPRHVSEDLGIPFETVKSWRRRLKRGELQLVAPQKRAGDLLGESVEASLGAMISQSERVADPEWLRQQSAGELAVLHGVMFDKTLRVLQTANLGEGRS